MVDELKNDQEQKIEQVIDYKDVRCLSRFLTERGKIIPSRVSSQSVKKQREIAQAIKRARILALLPFVSR
ncbi:MAG: 30S ribosomal protein S18 [Holosporales bacterium]|jgi:small subunit ribosomal protein S18|nr:30S ribosomal protein S18 [Holosporales bacterium]